ncbi:hypothetical protein BCR44DRAFT_61214 [Catenaria anguillulae PL171]|uniref:Uncharacterized protein n=1 Tax=Catenaria anguillulae PL171 TaxID=765915 RepID=A0A1Y2H5B5_9FUNG|nr:hypothetical protein BCR44DRAFT_61214 [Catenaria anguillulae PL171]
MYSLAVVQTCIPGSVSAAMQKRAEDKTTHLRALFSNIDQRIFGEIPYVQLRNLLATPFQLVAKANAESTTKDKGKDAEAGPDHPPKSGNSTGNKAKKRYTMQRSRTRSATANDTAALVTEDGQKQAPSRPAIRFIDAMKATSLDTKENRDEAHLRVLKAIPKVSGGQFVCEAIVLTLNMHFGGKTRLGNKPVIQLFLLMMTIHNVTPTNFLTDGHIINISPAKTCAILFDMPELSIDWLQLARHLILHISTLDAATIFTSTYCLAPIAVIAIHRYWTKCNAGASSEELASIRDVLCFTVACLQAIPIYDKAVHPRHQSVQLSDLALQELRGLSVVIQRSFD